MNCKDDKGYQDYCEKVFRKVEEAEAAQVKPDVLSQSTIAMALGEQSPEDLSIADSTGDS